MDKKKNFSTFSYKLHVVQISPIMILVNSGTLVNRIDFNHATIVDTRDFFSRPGTRREITTRETNILTSRMSTNPWRRPSCIINHAQRSFVI